MTLLELIAVAFSLLAVLLSVSRNVLNWPLGLIGVGAYFVLFLEVKLYADLVLQVVFFIQGIYGWLNWRQQAEGNFSRTGLVPEWMDLKGNLFCLLTLCVGIPAWALLLSHFTDASLPWIDATAAGISLMANWLMARMKTESWLLWILADLIYIALFIQKELYPSAVIYAIFLGIAVNGFFQWQKARNIATASS